LITKLKMWLDKLGVRKNVVAKDALLREVLGISTPKADKKKASSERYSKTSAAVATASYTSSHVRISDRPDHSSAPKAHTHTTVARARDRAGYGE
jgi:hypothetical protein